MNADKDFYIYTDWKGFYNFERLSTIGKSIYALFYVLKSEKNKYFYKIRSIKVTSQDRPNDTGSAHSYPGKAIDITIKPVEYMLYYAGLIHSLKPYNVYIGTTKYKNNKYILNRHIHIDEYYNKRKNTLYYESAKDKKLYLITKNNINSLLDLYNFSFLDNIRNFGGFKLDTVKYLLTNLPVNEKIKLKDAGYSSLATELKNMSMQNLSKVSPVIWIAGIGITSILILKMLSLLSANNTKK